MTNFAAVCHAPKRDAVVCIFSSFLVYLSDTSICHSTTTLCLCEDVINNQLPAGTGINCRLNCEINWRHYAKAFGGRLDSS